MFFNPSGLKFSTVVLVPEVLFIGPARLIN